MVDMDVQIKITADSEGAKTEVTGLSQSFVDAKEEIESTGKALQETGESAGKAAEKVKQVSKEAKGIGEAEEPTSNLSKALKELEKSSKKLGMALSASITAPLAGLAAISFKNLYDVGAIEGSSGPAREFAIAVQGLVENFKNLSIEIATQFMPVALKVIGLFNTLIDAYRSLDADSQSLVNTFAIFAAAIGPALLALSGLLSIMGTLAPVFGAVTAALGGLISVLTSPITIIAGLVATVAGLVNVFLKLREAGVGTADALRMSFNLFVTGFNNYVTKNILRGISLILSGFSKLASFVSEGMGKAIVSAKASVDSAIESMTAQFDASKGQVDGALAKLGTSAGEAFTFGLSTKLSGAWESISKAFDSASSNVVTSGILKSEQEAIDKRTKEMEDLVKQRSRSIAESISGDLSTAFLDFADGSKTAAEAFSDFARQTVRSLAQIATQAAIMNALFPPGSPMGNMIGAFASATQIKGFATGGYVSGPGTGTSDSIMARLSNGEFVTDAKTVRHFGIGFFENLKSLASGGVPFKRASSVPAFADGGMVTSPSQAPQVIIENKGTPSRVTDTSYDAESAVLTVVIDDIGKNGPLSKAMQNTFGVKRGGFR